MTLHLKKLRKKKIRLTELSPSQETDRLQKMHQHRLNLLTTDERDYKNKIFVENDNLDNDYAENSHGPEKNYNYLKLLMYNDGSSSD